MKRPIYLALDFPTWEVAKAFLEKNQLLGIPVKVGMELFYREGPRIIDYLKKNNHQIFLDLKLFDIPTTVHNAMKNIAGLGVDIVNVHALGGVRMIESAKEGLIVGGAEQTKLIAVTMLTSMDQKTMNNELMMAGKLRNNVLHFATLSKQGGVDGVVCSVQEVEAIKDTCGDEFLTVTPGIRLENSSLHDQKRIATPALARQYGADNIVIGRSITQSKYPKSSYHQAKREWMYK